MVRGMWTRLCEAGMRVSNFSNVADILCPNELDPIVVHSSLYRSKCHSRSRTSSSHRSPKRYRLASVLYGTYVNLARLARELVSLKKRVALHHLISPKFTQLSELVHQTNRIVNRLCRGDLRVVVIQYNRGIAEPFSSLNSF